MTPQPALMQAAGLLFWLGALGLAEGLSLSVLLQSTTGRWMSLYVLAATGSALLAEPFAPGGLLRYIAVFGAYYSFLIVGQNHELSTAVKAGILVSIYLFVGYHLLFLQTDLLHDPRYRYGVFINPNGMAFIASVGAVAAAARLGTRQRTLVAPVLFGISAVLCYSAKSRTAAAALMVGIIAVLMVGKQSRLFRAKALVAIVSVVVLMGANSDRIGSYLERVSEVYSFRDKYRSIGPETLRFQTWRYLFTEVWTQRPLVGSGPGSNSGFTEAELGVSSAHNGLLLNLVELGLVGTVPLVAVLIVAGRSAPKLSDLDKRFCVGVLAVAITESLGEIMFFSVGNPASLLFLFCLAFCDPESQLARRQNEGK